ncbi:MAG: ribonuclease HI family protein, partial [Spirochaetes bacterium]|nr:ribonuclease HI family protein [Spirochaetota bacterium]
QVINSFITENKNVDLKLFTLNLQHLNDKLSFFLNKNNDNDITPDTVLINTDGSSKGNPGYAKIGIIIKGASGKVLLKEQKEIGIKTNNQAEYIAVIEALKIALEKKYERILLFSDSELIINQINNSYKIKNDILRDLYNNVKILEKRFKFIKFNHISREFNKEADLLSR